MRGFTAPRQSFAKLDADATATLLTAAADVALVVDGGGIIRDLACREEELSRELVGDATWLGRAWRDTVLPDSLPKVDALLADAASGQTARWRHVNQTAANGGGAVPILYSALRLGDGGRICAFGRDLRPISVLQQRLVEAQQSIERDYSRLRLAETRYRLLFQMSAEPVFVLDSGSLRIVEANPPARALLDAGGKRGGRAVAPLFDADSRDAIAALLTAVRGAGRADDVRARLADAREVMASASLLRQDGAALLLLRLSFAAEAGAIVLPKAKTKLLKLAEAGPDAIVVTGEDGRIVTANAAFLELAQLTDEEAVRGEPVDRWLGRPGVDFPVLAANLGRGGSVRLFGTVVMGELGAETAVELSAVSVMNGGRPCYGFAIRDIGARMTTGRPAPAPHARTVEQLTGLIGRVPLKDLVREATDAIERLCIEAALELSGDNRASAAEMLGLSRQSLYVKLRRYGLGDLGAEEGG